MSGVELGDVKIEQGNGEVGHQSAAKSKNHTPAAQVHNDDARIELSGPPAPPSHSASPMSQTAALREAKAAPVDSIESGNSAVEPEEEEDGDEEAQEEEEQEEEEEPSIVHDASAAQVHNDDARIELSDPPAAPSQSGSPMPQTAAPREAKPPPIDTGNSAEEPEEEEDGDEEAQEEEEQEEEEEIHIVHDTMTKLTPAAALRQMLHSHSKHLLSEDDQPVTERPSLDNPASRERAETIAQKLGNYKIAIKGSGMNKTWRLSTTSAKYPVRVILLLVTVVFVAEMVLWLCYISTSSPYWYNWYDATFQTPQIFSAASAQTLFTHFMIHCERVYVNDELIPPEPKLALHPFQAHSTGGTTLLKLHFILHFFAYFLSFIGCFVQAEYYAIIEPALMMLLSPLIYHFLTMIYTTIRLRHGDLELQKMAENSFANGFGTIFICVFLTSESLGCYRYDEDEFEDCASTAYGNWMLGYQAFYCNVVYALLYWLVDSDFQIINLIRLRINAQYTMAFLVQIFASLIMILFFSQKEFPAIEGQVFWPLASSSFHVLWMASVVIICWKNVPKHTQAVDASGSPLSYFSDRHMFDLIDQRDAISSSSVVDRVSLNHTPATEQQQQEHFKRVAALPMQESKSDVLLGAEPTPDPVASPKHAKVEGGKIKGQTISVEGDVRFDTELSSPKSDEMNTKRQHSLYIWLRESRRIQEHLKRALTSKRLFALRIGFCSLTYLYLSMELTMIVQFSMYKKYAFESIGIVSFSALAVHYMCVMEHESIYVKSAWFEMKPLRDKGHFRWDRLFQFFISPKLQYYIHNATAFSWPIVAYFQNIEAEAPSLTLAITSFLRFLVSIVVYYVIIRRMCASLRDQMEKEKDGGRKMKEDLFIEGMGVLGVTIFLAFEINGCAFASREDFVSENYNTTLYSNEDDFLKDQCYTYYLANTCTGIHFVFLEIMSKLTFSQCTAVDLFTFNIARYQLIAFIFSFLPTFSAAFLFSRREQIEALDLIEDVTAETPLLYYAVQIGNNYFSLIWLAILFVLGYHAKPVRSYDFYKGMNRTLEELYVDEEDEEEDNEDVLTPNSHSKRARARSRWKKVKTTGAAVVQFKREGAFFERMKVQHKRMWILRSMLLGGSCLFVFAQVYYLAHLNDDGSETAKGFAFIVQPLSFACWLMHYFSVFNENENWKEYIHMSMHITGHTIVPIVMHFSESNWLSLSAYFLILVEWVIIFVSFRRMRKIMKEQHTTLLEIEKTLERFFGECASAFLVIFYVFLEAAGCVEDSASAGSCEPYFAGARTFATSMSVPLVIYVASFIADLSTYDVLVGHMNKTLSIGMAMTMVVGYMSVLAFAIRTWDLGDTTPIYYLEEFVDFWEVALYASLITIVRGVLKDFDTQQHEVDELIHRAKARRMRRYSVDANVNLELDKYGKKEKMRHLRKIRQLFADDNDDEIEAIDRARKRFGSESSGEGASGAAKMAGSKKALDFMEDPLGEDLSGYHPLGVHYRSSRGSRISSNYTGLII